MSQLAKVPAAAGTKRSRPEEDDSSSSSTRSSTGAAAMPLPPQEAGSGVPITAITIPPAPADAYVCVPVRVRVWVRKEGDAQFTKVFSFAADVDDLKKEIVKELGIEGRLSTLTLHIFKGEGSPLGDALHGEASLPDAGIVEGTKVVVKVATASAPPSAIRLENATTEQVYASLGPRAKAAVDAARAHRRCLTDNRVLTGLTRPMSTADAEALGINVLREEASTMTVGMFKIAALPHEIAEPPKTFDDLMVRPQQMLLLRQRLEIVFEVVNAVANKEPLGIHLSGPNGVGKSAIALLAFLVCAARRLPAVYIARSASWVDAARQKGGGDAYLLKTIWRQNADIIIEMPILRKVFAAALQDATAPFTADTMEALREAVRNKGLPGLAVITDEVQHITAEVQASLHDGAATEVQRAGRYFITGWYTWATANAAFQRMSVASAHAERDTKLPDGEEHRLRFIEPLDPADRAALQAAPQSPAYVEDAAARERVAYIGGNILRKIITAAALLPRDRKPSMTDLQLQWQLMWASMVTDCRGWLNSLDEPTRQNAARTAMSLMTGGVQWGQAAMLYDTGIVYRTADSPYVRPVSKAACAVILHVMASYVSATRKPLSTITDGRERGFELERQVLSALDSFAYVHGVPAKLLDGSPAPAVDLRCSYSLPFGSLEEVVSRDVPILYRPASSTFPCDAIRMPAIEDSEGSICVIECSTTDPLAPKRIEKVHKWFMEDGVVSKLRETHPGRAVTVALFYDGFLKTRAYASLSDGAKSLIEAKRLSRAPSQSSAAGDATSRAVAGRRTTRPAHVGRLIADPPVSAATASHTGVKKRGRKPKVQQDAAVPATGSSPHNSSMVCVIDTPSLSEPLCLCL